MERVQATAEQARALANPVRLRIIRLCLDDELTNRELAERLDRDPSTILHHTRVLVEAGLLEPADERPGPRGSTEKPYRTTGLSWRLDFDQEHPSPEMAILEAVREELQEAGPGGAHTFTRLALHLDEEALVALVTRLKDVLVEAVESDDERRAAGHPPVGLLLLLHSLGAPERSSD